MARTQEGDQGHALAAHARGGGGARARGKHLGSDGEEGAQDGEARADRPREEECAEAAWEGGQGGQVGVYHY